MIYSYTRINDWRTCPRQFYEVYVARNFKKSFGAAAEDGIKKHKILETALKEGDFLEAERLFSRRVTSLVTSLRVGGAEAELSKAITTDGRAVDFFSKDPALRLRGKIDVTLPGKKKVLMVDWKTGAAKNHKDDLQAKVYAALMSPEWKEVNCHIYFVKEDLNFPYALDTAQAFDEVMALTETIDQDEFYDPKPSGLCKKHCPVITCKYNK